MREARIRRDRGRGGHRRRPRIDDPKESTRMKTPLGSHISRRRLLQGVAVAAPALALPLSMRSPMARAQDKPEITMWFDTTNGPETSQCMVDGVISTYSGDAT